MGLKKVIAPSRGMLIVTLIITSAFMISQIVTPNSTVNANQTGLTAGDSYLYKTYETGLTESNYSTLLEQYNENESSWKAYSVYQEERNTLKSYLIEDFYGGYSDISTVTSTFSRKLKDLNLNYDYNYANNNWELSTNCTDSSSEVFNSSVAEFLGYYEVYNGLLFDPLLSFRNTILIENFTDDYVINGMEFSLNVTHYQYYENNTYNDSYQWYDLTVNSTYVTTTIVDYYIDNDTGIMIAADYEFYDILNEFTYNYSMKLNTNVTIANHYEFHTTESWSLYQTTDTNYGTEADADLPVMINADNFSYIDINDPMMREINYSLDLFDQGNYMNLEVYYVEHFYDECNDYTNLVLLDEYYGLYNGYFNYTLYLDRLPKGETMYEIEFVLYDGNNGFRNTTWSSNIYINQQYNPLYMSGPNYFSVPAGVSRGENYDIYASGNWNLDIYRSINEVIIPYDNATFWDHINGYDNGSYWLNHPPEIEGTYYYYFILTDEFGGYFDMMVTVEVTNQTGDNTAPVINGPFDPYYANVGEGDKLHYTVTDENLKHVTLKRNGTIIFSVDVAPTQYDFDIDTTTLAVGTYVFEIYAVDDFGNDNTATVYVYIQQGDNNSSSNSNNSNSNSSSNSNDSNTLNLDAPNNYIYTALVLTSFATIVSIYRRRRR